ncbi:MAG: NosD domain-containing protein [Elusimicrobiota bacterium]
MKTRLPFPRIGRTATVPLGALFALAVAFCAPPAQAAECGGAVACACGDTIMSDYTMSADLDCSADEITATKMLTIGANGVVLDCAGHSITGKGEGIGVEIYQITDATARDCRISGFEYGIRSHYYAHRNRLLGNTITSATVGIYIGKGYPGGHVVEDNAISNAVTAVHLHQGARNNQVSRNAISDVVSGVRVEYVSTGNTVTFNDIATADYGIPLVNQSKNNVVTDNTIHNARIAAVHEDATSAPNTIENNTVTMPPATECASAQCVNDATAARRDVILTADIAGGVYMGANGATLDCRGHAITGDGTGRGVDIIRMTHVSVRDCRISDFEYGVRIHKESHRARITGNTISATGVGVYIGNGWPDSNVVEDNAITDAGTGVELYAGVRNSQINRNTISNVTTAILLGLYSTPNTFTQNDISTADYGFRLVSHSNNNVITDNAIHNARIAAIHEDETSVPNAIEGNTLTMPPAVECASAQCVDDATAARRDVILTADIAGGVYMGANGATLDCQGHSITGDGTGRGVDIIGKTHVLVQNCRISNFEYGFRIHKYSHCAKVLGNTITSTRLGVYIGNGWPAGNVLDGNSISGADTGITVAWGAVRSEITGNAITDAGIGIDVIVYSPDNIFTANAISAASFGIRVSGGSDRNEFAENTVTATAPQGYGIYITDSSNNVTYRNDFSGPAGQEHAYVSGGSGNVFDLGPETGGNWWSEWPADGDPSDGSTPYLFTGGRDDHPFEHKSGWRDSDGDGVTNDADNCPATFNPGQEDFDGDGDGDACDADDDDDGLADADDACPFEHPQGQDANADGCTDRLGDAPAFVEELDLPGGTANALGSKLEEAIESAAKGNTTPAINKLRALINSVEAQRGKKISEADADALIGFVENAIGGM